MEIPDPTNNEAISDLHKFIDGWVHRHSLTRAKEISLLGAYLAGRLNLNEAMENFYNSLKEDFSEGK